MKRKDNNHHHLPTLVRGKQMYACADIKGMTLRAVVKPPANKPKSRHSSPGVRCSCPGKERLTRKEKKKREEETKGCGFTRVWLHMCCMHVPIISSIGLKFQHDTSHAPGDG